MPYMPENAGFLDYALAPLKVLGSPWGAAQTALSQYTGHGGDWLEALQDPDKAVRGRQLLENMGWAGQDSGAWADAAGMGLDIADPLSMLAFGGVGKGIQALRGIPGAARAVGAAGAAAEGAGAGLGRRALGHAFGFGLPMAGAALAGENDREGWHNPLVQGLSTAMEMAPLAHGGYNLAKGLYHGMGGAAEAKTPGAGAAEQTLINMAKNPREWFTHQPMPTPEAGGAMGGAMGGAGEAAPVNPALTQTWRGPTTMPMGNEMPTMDVPTHVQGAPGAAEFAARQVIPGQGLPTLPGMEGAAVANPASLGHEGASAARNGVMGIGGPAGWPSDPEEAFRLLGEGKLPGAPPMMSTEGLPKWPPVLEPQVIPDYHFDPATGTISTSKPNSFTPAEC